MFYACLIEWHVFLIKVKKIIRLKLKNCQNRQGSLKWISWVGEKNSNDKDRDVRNPGEGVWGCARYTRYISCCFDWNVYTL